MSLLLLLLLVPFFQGNPVEKPQDPVPEKVGGGGLVENGVETVSLPPVTRVTYGGEKVPIVEVLRELGKITGFNVTWRYIKESDRVTVSWKEVTPLEVFDDLCRKHGNLRYHIQMEYSYNRETRKSESKGVHVVFQRGKIPEAPRVYLDHYRASLSRLTLTRETDYLETRSEGKIQAMLLWTPDVKPRLLQAFRMDTLEDDQGKSLLDPGKNKTDFFRKIQSWSKYREQKLVCTLSFLYPASGVSKLALAKGEFLLRYPEKVRDVRFENLGGEVLPQKYRGVVITLKEYRATLTSISLKLMAEGKWEIPQDPYLGSRKTWRDPFPFDIGDILLVAGDETEFQLERATSQPGKKSMTFSLQFENPGKKKVKFLRVRCAEKYQYVKIPFEWRDVPLPASD